MSTVTFLEALGKWNAGVQNTGGLRGGSDTPGLTLETKPFFFFGGGGVSGKSLKNDLSLAIVKKSFKSYYVQYSLYKLWNIYCLIVVVLWRPSGLFVCALFAPPFQVCGIGGRGCPLGLTGSTRAQCRQSLFKLPLHGPSMCFVWFFFHISHQHHTFHTTTHLHQWPHCILRSQINYLDSFTFFISCVSRVMHCCGLISNC